MSEYYYPQKSPKKHNYSFTSRQDNQQCQRSQQYFPSPSRNDYLDYLKKNTTKSASYLNRSKSPTLKTEPSTNREKYNLTPTSQEISKQILKNLRQKKNQNVVVKSIDNSSFTINTIEQEKKNCDSCYNKRTQFVQFKKEPIDLLIKRDRNLQFCQNILNYSYKPNEENDLFKQMLMANQLLNSQLLQLQQLHNCKEDQWKQTVQELQDQLRSMARIHKEPVCLKNSELIMNQNPIDVQFQHLLQQGETQLNNRYEKLIRNLYNKLQNLGSADMILKQMTGKQNDRNYLKIIEQLRQKYNQLQKQYDDQSVKLNNQTALLNSFQEGVQLIVSYINKSQNLNNLRIKSEEKPVDIDDIITILQYIYTDKLLIEQQERINEMQKDMDILCKEIQKQKDNYENEIVNLKEAIKQLEKQAIDGTKVKERLSMQVNEQNVMKELALIILSKKNEDDMQERLSTVLQRNYGDILLKNEEDMESLTKQINQLSKQLEQEKEQNSGYKKQLEVLFERFMLITKSFELIPKRILEQQEVLQIAADTINQIKPQLVQDYMEFQSNESTQNEEDSLLRISSHKEDYFQFSRLQDDQHSMLMLQALTIEEYLYQIIQQISSFFRRQENETYIQRDQFSFQK